MAMTSGTIDIVILVTFLVINLSVGLRYGRKAKELKEFALGGKNFSTGTLTATIIATGIGGGAMFRTIELTYTTGLHYILATLGASLGIMFTGMIGSRMGRFLNNVSIVEAIGDLYGKAAQGITAICGIAGMLGGLAIQFNVISKILKLFLGVEGTWVTVVAATLIILYSSLGGIKAVTFTDVIQFATFGIFIPTLAITIWSMEVKGLHIHWLPTLTFVSKKWFVGLLTF